MAAKKAAHKAQKAAKKAKILAMLDKKRQLKK